MAVMALGVTAGGFVLRCRCEVSSAGLQLCM
jgi:hypothetical protein